MNIKPLGNRILIKRSKPAVTKGGLYLPQSAQAKPKEGKVVAVGPGKSNEEGKAQPVNVKVGDQILFSSYAGVEVKTEHNEEEYLILAEDEILGILI